MHFAPIPTLMGSATEALLRKDFSYFDISPHTGFLDLENTAYRISKDLQENAWEDALEAARKAWPHGESAQDVVSDEEGVEPWRRSVRNMTVIEALSPQLMRDKSLLRRAYVVLSMVGHFYIHGTTSKNTTHRTDESHNPSLIPRPLAIPWLQVSHALGLKPVLSYAAQVMWNCTLDPSHDTQTADRIEALETFTSHPSEIAFVKAPARVEFEGAAVLKSIFDILSTHLRSSDLYTSQSDIIIELQKMEEALKKMRSHLLVLKKNCDPSHFYWTLRPWIAGSGPEGWSYQLEGESKVDLKLGGSTAGSSSLLQALDSFLGLDFGESHLAFRCSMQEYMPQGHRLFIQTLENLSTQDVLSHYLHEQVSTEATASPFRAYVKHIYANRKARIEPASLPDQALQLVLAYNNVIRALKDFRDEHFRIVSLFVINQANKQPKDQASPMVTTPDNGTPSTKETLKGTGGSDLAKLLKGYRNSSQAALFVIE
ncbi:hypothetical protein T440DRAFT_113905 [Plenodomus tracheiphilus IPT5]|uniref:Indoleamine 2,3-dioxygenase n=1 Tax=Plenodomus tracheiphilus IPT5 TaxID=1408161 RepID=A0A6A7B4D3_9PLEO|nr:hypothetical protein T440DRAFT_113905 [Plenodomus tracheiphilus IPT5]